MEQFADVFFLQVNRGQHDVARRLVAQLHDPFAEIRIRHLDAARFEVRVEVALLGKH